MSAQSTQRDSVRVLAGLVETGLPPLSWNVFSSGTSLDGQPSGDDGRRIAVLTEWAAHTDKTHTWVSVPLSEGGAQ